MAIHPPWNTTITITGSGTEEDRWGQTKPAAPHDSEARVKYSGEHIFNARGEETTAKLEMRVPEETRIEEGDTVAWVDPFGETVTTRVAKIQDVLDYPGVVQYRKVWTE